MFFLPRLLEISAFFSLEVFFDMVSFIIKAKITNAKQAIVKLPGSKVVLFSEKEKVYNVRYEKNQYC